MIFSDLTLLLLLTYYQYIILEVKQPKFSNFEV